MSVLWTAAEAAIATGGKAVGDWQVTGLSIDTRSIAAGEMFVALKDQRDGHDFVADALKKGAGAALVSRIPEGVSKDAPLLIVEDVLRALEDMGRFARARAAAKVIGVTGSVGKTSTKEMLRTVFDPNYKTHAAVKSFNNHWGVPLTLARMPAETEIAIIEIGMNAPGEIAPLAKMADLDVAIVTTVAAVHAEAFENVQGIAREKAAIFGGLRMDGSAVFNADFETVDIVAKAAKPFKTITFGMHEDADFQLARVQSNGAVTSCLAEAHGTEIIFKFQAAGAHFAQNALAVLAAAEAVGMEMSRAMMNLADWTAPAGRGARSVLKLGGKSIEVIDESYNANPTSVGAAMAVLASSTPADPRGRRIAMLGDMLELGPEEAALHAGLADHKSLPALDLVHCVGPRMHHLYDALPYDKRGNWYSSSDELIAELDHMLRNGDVVMIKGSLGAKMGPIVDALNQKAQGG
ncbi:MAG: UDP-N-acetylmuramoyl-tripeptide--D-alanyl-D-alanine ligase [Pseudomonadota bacterium]